MVDFSKVPGTVTLTNNGTRDLKILSEPGFTQGFVLPAGESVKFLAEHSYELVSFYAQAQLNEDLDIELPA